MEKEELDKKKMHVDMCRFRIGDIVQIPKEMLDEYKEEKSIPEMIPAKVKQLCKAHIVFELYNGTQRSLLNFDCMKIHIVKQSGFEIYGKKHAERDILDAFENIHVTKPDK